METTNKKKFKGWMANLIALFIQIIIGAVFVILYGKGVSAIYSGNLSGGFESIKYAIWFMNIAVFIVSLIYLFVKPMRTILTIIFAIWNFVCIGFFIYAMYNPTGLMKLFN